MRQLGESTDFKYLVAKDKTFEPGFDEERMRKINEFVFENFNKPITVNEVAALANMTETSFCRYFKTRTLKTFVEFLNDLRISYACRLLYNEDYSVTDACFESGFNSVSYFNRQFNAVVKMSPLRYKKWKTGVITKNET